MNENIKVEVIKPKNSLFCNYIYKAIPLAFDESLSYYECLCGLLYYLKNTIIPTVNNNANAVIELQNNFIQFKNDITNLYNELKEYVDNYLTDETLQPLINNKLDELVADGTLENLIGKYIDNTMIRSVETVEQLKAMDLDVNAKVRTLGYHNINDGGGSLYLITDTKEDNNYYEDMNNGKYAQLIIENNTIAPQQFGAYGDGENDDTIPFQKCIDFAENIIISNDVISKNEYVVRLSGIYKITNTLILSPYLTYELKGDPTIMSYLTDGTAVHIKYRNNITNDNPINDSTAWTRGDMFVGDNLHIINHYTRNNSNVIGLEIQNTENPQNTYSAFARGNLGNITVNNFNIGIKLNDYHCYIYEFHDLVLYYNNINFQVGDPTDTNTDFGENVVFRNCLFGTSFYGFMNNIASSHYTFYSCSFDFNTKGAIFINKQCTINIINGWIEGCLNNADSELTGIISTPNDNIYASVNIQGTRFMQSHGNRPLFGGKNLTITIDHIIESYVDNLTNEQLRDADCFYIAPNSILKKYYITDTIKMLSPKWNKIINKSLANETAGTPIVNNGNTVFVKYYFVNENTNMSIVSDNNENCVSIASTSPNLFNAEFYLDEDIPVENAMSSIYASFLYKAIYGEIKQIYTFTFLDENKTNISSKTWNGTSAINKLSAGNDWQKPINVGVVEDIPINTKYVRIRMRFQATSYCPQLLIKNFHVEMR